MCPKLQEHTFMDRKTIFTFIAIYGFVGGIGVFATSDAPRQEAPAPETTSSFIVQGESLTSVTAIVRSVGGDITHELGVIRSVGAMLTAAEAASLRTHADIRRVYGNGSIEVAGHPGNPLPDESIRRQPACLRHRWQRCRYRSAGYRALESQWHQVRFSR
jgi:hypothetical protein